MKNKHSFEAVIFDLDGVITKTADIHSKAWKLMFDSYLYDRNLRFGEPFKEFSNETDYLTFVDGKPRYEGVKDFLASRAIDIPYGEISDSTDKETICGLGNRKNIYFNEILNKDGVETYKSTIDLIHELRKKGIKVGVASSSKNCKTVLKAANLIDLFATCVDGETSLELGLKGKPEADIFIKAADNLGIACDNVVIVEDAISGVQAGKKGNFGLILGIAREDNMQDLYINGADIVVRDIEEIGFKGLVKWFEEGKDEDGWSITYYNYDKEKERSRESLLTTGNGYFACRGAMEESKANKINYPGTYMAGLYNRLSSVVSGKKVENEDFVNAPNWLTVNFKIDNGEYQDMNAVEVVSILRNLDFKSGLLRREIVVKDPQNRLTKIISFRFASMKDENLAALEYKIQPLNYSGVITVNALLSANHTNKGVDRYNDLNQNHLKSLFEKSEEDLLFLAVKTSESNILITESAKLQVYLNDKLIIPEFDNSVGNGIATTEFSAELSENETLMLQKLVVLKQWKNDDIEEALRFSINKLSKIIDFDHLIVDSAMLWRKLWQKIDIKIEGDRLSQKLLRLHLYHLLSTTSLHNINLDFSIPARGLHGEAYRGHIFWDEMFVLPVYFIHFKEIARSVLLYRYRRLGEARKYAAENGYKGAMFPWQSGSSGIEETQKLHLNPANGKWNEDYSCLQRHVSLAIAYNIIQYHHICEDNDFMLNYGAEMLIEICRFWESKCKYDEVKKRYTIDKVMGPDEFHEMYDGATEGGLNDNAYTNIMTIWVFEKTLQYLHSLIDIQKEDLFLKLNFCETEINKWIDISENLNIVISDEGIISQFDGYFDLKELDWELYKTKYGNIYRMDRILKAENLSPDKYKVAKQADTMMLFYNLDVNEVDSIFKKLNYNLPDGYLERNFDYYLSRTSHGSTLSKVVHSYLASKLGKDDIAWQFFAEALKSDYADIQGGTTAEGIHTGVMASTIWIFLTCYAGIDLKSDFVRIKPNLPKHWNTVSFNFNFKSILYKIQIKPNEISIFVEAQCDEIKIFVNNEMNIIECRQWITIKY